jgi:hypothetical protein
MVKRKQHIGIFLHNEMAISAAGISPMCDHSSMPRQKIFFLRSIEQTGAWPQVFSMASWKQRSLNERLLAVCIEKLALEPRWVKKHPSYDELRSYGAIAA